MRFGIFNDDVNICLAANARKLPVATEITSSPTSNTSLSRLPQDPNRRVWRALRRRNPVELVQSQQGSTRRKGPARGIRDSAALAGLLQAGRTTECTIPLRRGCLSCGQRQESGPSRLKGTSTDLQDEFALNYAGPKSSSWRSD